MYNVIMLKAIIFDLCRVFLFPKKEDYFGELNSLYHELSKDFNFKFSDNFIFNKELIDLIRDRHLDTNLQLYIFTSGKIQETVDCQRFLNGYFKKIFSAEKLNLSKREPSAYLMLADQLNLNPSEILFVDDTRQNTQAAETAGFRTITFRNNIQFETEIGGYIVKT